MRTRDGGFTLTELMMVIAIMALLVVIAIPSFLSFRHTAQDRDAQSTLVNAEKMVSVVGLEHDGMPSNAQLLTLLAGIDGTFTWTVTLDPSTGPRVVSIEEDEGTEVAMAVRSKSGTCFYLRARTTGPSIKHRVDAAADCVGVDFVDGGGIGW
jgi:prepilin-type N-terminal cleavage/methylation domain-containing protein